MPAVGEARLRPALAALLLFVLTFLLYAPVRHLPFVALDDDYYVTENPKVQAGLTAKSALWAFTSVGYTGNWHPLTWISHMVDVELFGAGAGGPHLVNAGLHAANAVLLFAVFHAATGALWGPVLVAALFAAHPLRVESVAWVAERKDVLSSSFGLLALIAWIQYTRRPGIARYLAAALSLSLSLMSKAMLATLPVLLLLLDWWPLGRWRRARERGGPLAARLVAEKLPLLALSIGAAAVALVAQQREGAVNLMDPAHQSLRYASALLTSARYLGQLLWPRGLAVLYAFPQTMPSLGKIAAAASLVGGTLAVALVARRRAPWIGFGVGWYLITLLPVIGIVKIGMSAGADRYTYLPLAGILLLVVWSLRRFVGVPGRRTLRNGPLIGAVLLLSALGGTTRRQIQTWSSSQALFDRVRQVEPVAWWRTSVGEYNLAVELTRQGRFDEAKKRYDALVRSRSGAPGARNNLAGLLLREGRAEEAERLLREGLLREPRDVKMRDNLGVALALRGRLWEALDEFRAALAADPRDAVAYNNIGHTWERLGYDEQAASAYREAVRLAPDDPGPAQRLRDVLARLDGRAAAPPQR